MRENKNATIVQSLIRGVETRSSCLQIKMKKSKAAIVIERYWRGYRARIGIMKYRELLEVQRFENQIRLLDSERKYWTDIATLEELKSNDQNYFQQLQNQSKNLDTSINAIHNVVDQQEHNYRDLKSQLENIRPLLIEKGWEKTLKENLKKCRNLLTEKKLECILKLGKQMKKNNMDINNQKSGMMHAQQQKDQWERWRNEEMQELWKFQQKKAKEKETLERKRKIAHERRFWKINFTTKTGKPDKMRRPGKPWNPSVFSNSARNGYSSGAIDLLVQSGLREGSDGKFFASPERIESVIEHQSYLTEVQQYEEIWNPISQIMHNM